MQTHLIRCSHCSHTLLSHDSRTALTRRFHAALPLVSHAVLTLLSLCSFSALAHMSPEYWPHSDVLHRPQIHHNSSQVRQQEQRQRWCAPPRASPASRLSTNINNNQERVEMWASKQARVRAPYPLHPKFEAKSWNCVASRPQTAR